MKFQLRIVNADDFIKGVLNTPLKVCPKKREPCEYHSGEGCYHSGKKEDITEAQCDGGDTSGMG